MLSFTLAYGLGPIRRITKDEFLRYPKSLCRAEERAKRSTGDLNPRDLRHFRAHIYAAFDSLNAGVLRQ